MTGLISSWFSARKRGLGLISFRFYIPALLALPGGNDWRTAWHWLGGMTLLIALLSALILRDRPWQGT